MAASYKKTGFTLIELMIVVVIISILSAIAIPKFRDVTENSKKAACRANMRTIASQETIYFMNHFHYTSMLSELEMTRVICPSGEPYDLVAYEYGGVQNTAFTITCTFDPSHGEIDNGIASWQGE